MTSLTPNSKGSSADGGASRISRYSIIAGSLLFALGAHAPVKAQRVAAAPQVRVEASSTIANACPGEESRARVRLRAAGIGPGCVVRYIWSATGGRIVGSGSDVVWDFSGTPPGDRFYEATLTVEAAPGCGAPRVVTAPARVVVWSCPPRVNVFARPARRAGDEVQCPNISLCCRAVATPGTPAPFIATLSGDTRGVVPTFNWTLSGGEVVGGQGTSSIQIDAKDFKGKSILTTVDVGGYGRRCSASCLTEVGRAQERPLTLSVSVRNALTGRPVPRAKLSFYLGASPVVEGAEADEGGSFWRAGLTPGTYRVLVGADRFAPQESAVTLDRFSTGSVMLSLNPAAAPTPSPTPSPTPTPTPTPTPSPTPTPDETPSVTAEAVTAAPTPRPLTLVQGSSRLWIPIAVAVLAALAAAATALVKRGGVRVDETAPADETVAGESSPAADATEVSAEEVRCTVFAPEQVAPADVFQVTVYAHLLEQAPQLAACAAKADDTARDRGSTVLNSPVERGGELTFKLQMPGLEVLEPEQSLVWRGRTEPPPCVQFAVVVPDDCKPKSTVGIVKIYYDKAPVGQIMFKLRVAEAGAPQPARDAAPPPQEQVRYKKAFISYCSKDRDKVARGLQGLKHGLKWAGIDYFMDLQGIESGEYWSDVIKKNLDESDLFVLFWSSAAKQSGEVEKEYKYALARKGGSEDRPPFFEPITIELPLPEPPPELKSLHFNDELLYIITTEETLKARGNGGGVSPGAGA